MKLSTILTEMGISFNCNLEKNINSLGLAGYNDGDAVCTFLDNIKYAKNISDNVVMLITNQETYDKLDNCNNMGICVVKNPRKTFFEVHNHLADLKEYNREAFKTEIGENCHISPLASVASENVHIGNNVIIEDFCTVESNTYIGNNCIIRSGCRIGSEGFEFKRDGDEIFRVKHVGGVILEDNVEVHCNTCVNKAIYPWDDTILGKNVKIDDLVHIAHGVKIGAGSFVVTQSTIGGRTKVGRNVWIGIGAQIRNGLTIGDNAHINMGSVVTKSVAADENVSGNFAIEHSKFIDNLKKSVL